MSILRPLPIPLLLCAAALPAAAQRTSDSTAAPRPVEDVAAELGPLRVFSIADGPLVVLASRPSSDVLAVRLSVPLDGALDSVGLARVLQTASASALERRADALGAELVLRVDDGAAVHSIVGAATDAAALVSVLRQAVGPLNAGPAALDAARHRLAEAALATTETPAGAVRARLSALLYPLLPTRAGEAAAAAELSPAALRRFLGRYYQPTRMRVVIVGPIDEAGARSLLGGWVAPEAAPPAGGEPDTSRATAATEVEAMRAWAGVGWSLPDARTGDLAVVLPSVRLALAESGLDRTAAELWWQGGRAALVAIGAAPPLSRDSAGAVADRLGAAVMRATLHADAGAVRRAADATLAALGSAARTPDGMAELVGTFFDRTGDPLAVLSYVASVRAATETTVARALLELRGVAPVTVEIGP